MAYSIDHCNNKDCQYLCARSPGETGRRSRSTGPAPSSCAARKAHLMGLLAGLKVIMNEMPSSAYCPTRRTGRRQPQYRSRAFGCMMETMDMMGRVLRPKPLCKSLRLLLQHHSCVSVIRSGRTKRPRLSQAGSHCQLPVTRDVL